MVTWLANDAADACRVFRLDALVCPSLGDGWPMTLLMLAVSSVWLLHGARCRAMACPGGPHCEMAGQ